MDINGLLDQVDKRMAAFIIFSLFGMTLLAAYLYLFKMPIGELDEVRTLVERSRIDRNRQQTTDVQSILRQTQDEVAGLREQLYGPGENVAAKEMVPFIIRRLDQLSGQSNIRLMSVTPGQTSRVLMFDELAFEVSVSGNYLNLVNWLGTVEQELHPMVVKQFEMKSGQAGDKLLAQLKIVSYRPGSSQQ